jgi:quercetin dioxygenase-like cupin family protein
VLAPGAATEPHAHHEYEIFVAVSGTAVVEAEGDRTDFAAGDVVHMVPGEMHTIINAGQNDFQFYSVWWDADMATEFSTRHEHAAAAAPGIAS